MSVTKRLKCVYVCVYKAPRGFMKPIYRGVIYQNPLVWDGGGFGLNYQNNFLLRIAYSIPSCIETGLKSDIWNCHPLGLGGQFKKNSFARNWMKCAGLHKKYTLKPPPRGMGMEGLGSRTKTKIVWHIQICTESLIFFFLEIYPQLPLHLMGRKSLSHHMGWRFGTWFSTYMDISFNS